MTMTAAVSGPQASPSDPGIVLPGDQDSSKSISQGSQPVASVFRFRSALLTMPLIDLSNAYLAQNSAFAKTPDPQTIRRLLAAQDAGAPTDITQLVGQLLLKEQQDKEGHREAFLSAAPSLLSLHSEIQSSLERLDSLAHFLKTFSDDLSSVSNQISTLKQRSTQLDDELRRKRTIEEPLARIFAKGVVLDPHVVAKIFDTEVDHSWKDVVRQLQRSIEATRRPLDQIVAPPTLRSRARSSLVPILSRRELSATLASSDQPDSGLPSTAAPGSGGTLDDADAGVQRCLVEARGIAEACKVIAALKIRSHLVAPFNLFRTSVTTNLQVLQTSVLLPHHQPLYAFLARQMPRIAIDVQRAYVAAARLFFETGFRRYARALGQIHKRGYKKDHGMSSIVSVPSNSTGVLAGLFGGGGSTKTTAQGTDPYLTESSRLAHSLLSDNEEAPPVILGYMSDTATYLAPPEALFRSLSLVFFDNACSEFTFLVRYFEALSTVDTAAARREAWTAVNSRSRSAATLAKTTLNRSGLASTPPDNVLSPTSIAPPLPVFEEWDADGDTTLADDAVPEETMTFESLVEDGRGPPSESGAEAAQTNELSDGNLVRLSMTERKLLKGRGASAELFRKVFDPVIGTWLNFARAILYENAIPLTVGASSGTGVASKASGASSGTSSLNPLSNLVGVTGGSGGGIASTPLPLMPLLTMLHLLDQLLNLADERGVSSVLTEPLLLFKMEAWPLAQRKFNEEIDAMTRLAGVAGSKSSSHSGGSWWGALSGPSGGGSAERAQEALKSLAEDDVLVIAARYATLFAQVARLTSTPGSSGYRSAVASLSNAHLQPQSHRDAPPTEDPSSTMLSSSLLRLRSAFVALVQAKAKQAATSSSLIPKTVLRVRSELERGTTGDGRLDASGKDPGTVLGAKTMREVSWWAEWQREQMAADGK